MISRALGMLCLLVLPLSACGTPEYYAARQQCDAEWRQRIPADISLRPVTRYRTERRPTGRFTCHKVGEKLDCQHQMKTVQVPYRDIESVDLNAPERNARINQCTTSSCLRSFGNSECRAPGT